ncbi:M14 family metallopeptidase [Cohnella faecalis]|uniref:M14 family metallopeptidase n=1 Tax=Cohnella faecalis TaxID=2315694 RepID=UPI0026BAE6F0|nr:M14 family metallopeptidase [Cohnella faecalis]
MNLLTYVVREGDTSRRIAMNFGVSHAALRAANPQWLEGESPVPGELVHVPARLPRRYVCRTGDTIASVAMFCGCSAERLRACNPELGEDEPEAGQQLELPAGRADTIVHTSAEYGPDQLAKDLIRIKRSFPFVSVDSIGRSVLGKPIHALRIGEGPFRWHFNGSCHANEWITSLLLMKFAEDYARACRRRGALGGQNAASLFRKTSLWIVPMLNPDGAELAQTGLFASHPYYSELLAMNRGSARFHRWKANVHGVDLNDQFPAGWEEEKARRSVAGPGPRDYGGPSPLSEPEARAIAEFTERMDFHAVLSLHSQGEEIYWNYRDEEPPESERWANRLANASGYNAVKLSGSDAGYKDWFIHAFRRPGFTVEVGWAAIRCRSTHFRKSTTMW